MVGVRKKPYIRLTGGQFRGRIRHYQQIDRCLFIQGDTMNRDFKGVWIPKEIWLSSELSLLEKVILVEISSLDNEEHCTAGNDYFAEFCNCSKSAVTKSIQRLKELNLIKELSFDGRHRKLAVVNFTNLPSKIYEAESENLRPNNISNNPINKKSIISKDINTVQKSNSFLGSVKKPKQKQSLYSKAVGLINDFSDNQKIRDSLIDFLNLQLEIYKEQEKTFYINTFKNRLNKLRSEFSESDWLEVINYAVSRGWQNFYPIPTRNNFNADGENESYYDDDYLEQQENWQREMARNGKETKF